MTDAAPALRLGAEKAELVTPEPLSGRRRRRALRTARLEQRRNSRYALVQDTTGPKVRIGVVWFLAALAALAADPVWVAALYGVVAAVAALQSAQSWRRGRAVRPSRLVGAPLTLAVPLAAVHSLAAVGVAVLLLVVGALAAGWFERGLDDPLDLAGATIQCSLFVALAAGSVVVVARLGTAIAIVLVLLVSIYETGDYLVGSGASNAIEGPVAGMAGVAVATFAVAVVEPLPYEATGWWLMGALVALLAPVGQVAASAILPRSAAPAPALRRLDSLLVVGPVWAWIAWTTT